MRVSIRKIQDKEAERVIIECTAITPQIEDIRSYVLSKGTELFGLSEVEQCYASALNGRFYAHMKNGEKLIISRQYAPVLKKRILGGGNDEN